MFSASKRDRLHPVQGYACFLVATEREQEGILKLMCEGSGEIRICAVFWSMHTLYVNVNDHKSLIDIFGDLRSLRYKNMNQLHLLAHFFTSFYKSDLVRLFLLPRNHYVRG